MLAQSWRDLSLLLWVCDEADHHGGLRGMLGRQEKECQNVLGTGYIFPQCAHSDLLPLPHPNSPLKF